MSSPDPFQTGILPFHLPPLSESEKEQMKKMFREFSQGQQNDREILQPLQPNEREQLKLRKEDLWLLDCRRFFSFSQKYKERNNRAKSVES
jgi:hypothetical protein